MKTLPDIPRPKRETKALLKALALSCAALVAAMLLSQCGIPVAIVVQGQYGQYGYSSKSGLTATIHPDK
jgi:hypothetical protein